MSCTFSLQKTKAINYILYLRVEMQYPKTGFDFAEVHEKFHQLLQCLYKGMALKFFLSFLGNNLSCTLLASVVTSPLLTAGCLFLVRVLRGCTPPPLVSPLTTRAGKKRKREERKEEGEGESNGRLDLPLVTQWLEEVLHDFITVK